MINFNKPISLFINGEEYDFSKKISFDFHPTNFSSFTFNDVIKKKDNIFPNNTIINFVEREFSFVEIFQEKNLIFFGILNDTGRLSFFPNTVKTKSITVSDFRKWLSITKPINRFWFNKTPTEIVNDVVATLKEPRIQIGNLDFTINERIKAYNSEGKTPYQILKNVITKQSNSILFFNIQNGKILINYKSNQTFNSENSPIALDIKNTNFLLDYKIQDIEYQNETDTYANYLRYDSENLISNKIYKENNIVITSDKVTMLNYILKLDTNINNTFFELPEGFRKVPIIINSAESVEGKYYDIIFTQNSNILQIHERNMGLKLNIGYFIKTRIAYEAFNSEEINAVANISKTQGIVYQYEKFNDITAPNDLIRMLKTDIQTKANPQNALVVSSAEPIWDILDVVECNLYNNLSGKYLVHSVTGEADYFGDIAISDYTYTLKQSKNTDNYLNQFDNQSFRDQPLVDENTTQRIVKTLNAKITLISNIVDYEIIDIVFGKTTLQSQIQTPLEDNVNLKYKSMEVH